MKLTNNLNLPQPIVDAIKNDEYDMGEAHISMTGLLRPPRVAALSALHKDELEEDASDRIWSLFGQVMHGVLERADNSGIAERRLSMEVNGWTVTGAMDRYVDGLLQDYKFVTAWKFKGSGVPIEYEQQLNMYAALLRSHGHPVNKMQIVGILRDWSKMEASRDVEYPQRGVVVRTVPLWEPEKAHKFIHERVLAHQSALKELPECSFEERWAKPHQYAVMKDGAKRATKLYENKAEAELHAQQAKGFSVVERPGANQRCQYYCPVSEFCAQFKQLNKGNEI
jgi:hypothetical protein